MDKKENQKKKLLEAFQKEDSLSTQRIMEILNTSSKGTVNTYITYLRNDGYEIEENLIPHGRGAKTYHLSSADDHEYGEIIKKDWQKFIICSALYDIIGSESSVTRKQLIEYILKNKELNLDIKQSSLFNRINELCTDGTIYENTDTNPPTLMPGAEMTRIESLSLEDATKLTRTLSLLPNADPFYETIISIKESLSRLSDMVSMTEPPLSFISSGKKYEETTISEAISERFTGCNYKKYLCDMIYRGKKNNSASSMRVGIGLIVYVAEKDNIYAIGDVYYPDTTKEKIILQIDRIESAADAKDGSSKIPNPNWKSREFIQIYDEMFSISTKEPYTVRIRFEDKYYIESRLDALVKQRRSAKLERKEGYLEYSDKVRGLPDLRNYLRTFSDKCIVLEPEEMRDDIIEGIKRSFRLYGETI